MTEHELYDVNERLSRLEGRIGMVVWFLGVTMPLFTAGLGWCIQHHIFASLR